MKVALLSDIHGNSDALVPVLKEARGFGVSKIVVCGDLVGYYYNVDQVLDLLASWDCHYIGGNHEEMLKQWIGNTAREKIRAQYGSALKVASEKLNSTQINWLVNLPQQLELELEGKKLFICHGTSTSVDEYIYPDALEDNLEKFRVDGVDLSVYGHTHYPIVFRNKNWTIVNPGSVGQTRDRKPGACWAIWDSQTNSVELKRTAFDPNPVIKQCLEHDPEIKYLREVLVRK